MSEMVTVPASVLQGFVSFVEKAGALLEQVERDGTQAKEAAASTADLLIKQGLLDESQREFAVQSLSGSHAKTMETLRRTATHVAPPSMGASSTMHKDAGMKTSSTAVDDADRRFEVAMGFGS